MHHRPPAVLGTRATAGGLTLTVHGLFVVLLLLEDRELLQPLPASRGPTGMWIHLPMAPALAGPPPPGAAPEVRHVAPARAPRPESAISVTPLPPAAPAESGTAEPGPAAGIDWQLAAEKRSRTFAPDPVTFGPPVEAMRRPCMPRGYDAATRAKMNELLPPPPDLPMPGASAGRSVQMGGARVGLVTVVGGSRKRDGTSSSESRKSSFKWKWDYNPTGGSAGLTLGWEEPPKYDGMFDDMQQGKTPDSSVPDLHSCD